MKWVTLVIVNTCSITARACSSSIRLASNSSRSRFLRSSLARCNSNSRARASASSRSEKKVIEICQTYQS